MPATNHPDSVPPVTVSSAMLAPDIIALLVQRKCPDITHELDLSQCGRGAVAGGGFGDIYKGVLNGGGTVAIKCARLYLQQDDENGHKVLKRAARELYIWSRLKHDNILPLLGLAHYRDQIAMISPWMDYGTLLNYIERNPTIDRCQLFIEISEGMAYLHKKGTIHGDIKGGNVLISREGVAKLGDFGCTRALKQNTMRFTTTTSSAAISVRWAAPEVIKGDVARSKEADVYALGMTLLEAITGTVPFGGKTDMSVLYMVSIQKQTPGRPENFASFNEYQADLLWEMLLESWASDPSKRPDSRTIRSRVSNNPSPRQNPSVLFTVSTKLKKIKLSATELPRDASNRGLDAHAGPDQDFSALRQSTDNTPSTEAHAHPPRVDKILPGVDAETPRIVMAMPTPEPWRDPDHPRRHGNPDDAAMMAHVRALEEARKLAEGEVDEEDEESMQRYVMSKFGDQSGQNHDDTESENTEETEFTSESSSTTFERDHYVPSQPDPDLYYPNRDRDNQSRGTSVPAITVNSPSNDSNGSSAVTRTTNRDYDESLGNEPIDSDEIPGTFPPPPPSIPSPAPDHVDGIPAPYIGAPRTPEYTPNQHNRPPSPAPEVLESSPRWHPYRGLQPSGLPDSTNFDDEIDSLKYGPSPNRNSSRNSSRGSSNGFTRPNAQPSYQPPSFHAPSPQPAPPVISATTPSTPRPNSQGNSPVLTPPAAPNRSPSAHALPMPSMTPRGFGASLGAGLSAGFGFAKNSLLRGGASTPPTPAPSPAPLPASILLPVFPPVAAPVQTRTLPPAIPSPPPAPRGVNIRPLPPVLPLPSLKASSQSRSEASQTKWEYRQQKRQAVAQWLASIPDSSYYIRITTPRHA